MKSSVQKIHFLSKLLLVVFLVEYGRVFKTAHVDSNFMFQAYSVPKLWSSAISEIFDTLTIYK